MSASVADLVNPLLRPTMLSRPRRLTEVTPWQEHIPFAMCLVDLLRPDLFVELGTHRGDSYCAFCQAVDELELPTQAYAVDTWTGDAQAGFYGSDVLEDLREHHDSTYGAFSRLLQTTFDDAVEQFQDGSIDLLHIDGCHTYDAVKHDFTTWAGKLSSRGVVLFHDSNYRSGDFGVWRLWEELRARYPSFEFLHGLGLGVLFVGDDVPAAAAALGRVTPEETARVRELFSTLGLGVRLVGETTRLNAHIAEQQRVLDDRGHALEAQQAAIEDLRTEVAELEGRVQEALEEARVANAEVEALHATKLFRYSAGARRVYGALRSRG